MLPPFIIDLIKQVVALIASALFVLLLGKFPNFPIPKEVFSNFLIWLVLTLLGVRALVDYMSNKIAKRRK